MAETLGVSPAPATPHQAPSTTTKTSTRKPRKREPKRNLSPEKATSITEGKNASVGKKKVASTSKTHIQKPKLTKSRNGCTTCKIKRLKCDETKPTCLKCKQRNVVCGGYHKDFKWRSFEEQNCGQRYLFGKSSRQPDPEPNNVFQVYENAAIAKLPTPEKSTPPLSDSPVKEFDIDSGLLTPPDDALETGASNAPLDDPSVSSDTSNEICDFQDFEDVLSGSNSKQKDGGIQTRDGHNSEQVSDQDLGDFDFDFGLDIDEHMDDSWKLAKSGPASPSINLILPNSLNELLNPIHLDTASTPRATELSMTIPVTIDLCPESPERLLTRFADVTAGIMSLDDGPNSNPWKTLILPLAKDHPSLMHAILAMSCFHASASHPNLWSEGKKHLSQVYDLLRTSTQGIDFEVGLSVSLALAFAESWMNVQKTNATHIHGAQRIIRRALKSLDMPSCPKKVQWTTDERRRLKFLCKTWIYVDVLSRLTSVSAPVDFGSAFQSGDGPLTMMQYQQPSFPYLAPKYSYFETLSDLLFGPLDIETSIDPLMGLSATLFPIIGRVANLARTVCISPKYDLSLVEVAMDLKGELLSWQPPCTRTFASIEDVSVTLDHCKATAEAYRVATLIYLHQVVPEIVTGSQDEELTSLAQMCLNYIGRVPLSSRAVIVQIWPLFSASCVLNAAQGEMRTWVRGRWDGMAVRMGIGNVTAAKDVVEEVWKRRDISQAQWLSQDLEMQSSDLESLLDPDIAQLINEHGDEWYENGPISSSAPQPSLDFWEGLGRNASSERTGSWSIMFEETVRGRLHWAGVMRDWDWEVLLG